MDGHGVPQPGAEHEDGVTAESQSLPSMDDHGVRSREAEREDGFTTERNGIV